MHLIYIDESRDAQLCVFSGLAIPSDEWGNAFCAVREFRRALRRTDGILVQAEFHAWKSVSGRGNIADRIVAKGRRCRIFRDTLSKVAGLPGARLFNAAFPASAEERAFEALLERINRTMVTWDSRAILICDEGNEASYTRLARRLGAYSPVPSRYEARTETDPQSKGPPIARILEDPFFKRSEQSYFIQLVDFCAYALLRRERPVPSKTKYGIHEAFAALAPILVREANGRDPDGIVRP